MQKPSSPFAAAHAFASSIRAVVQFEVPKARSRPASRSPFRHSTIVPTGTEGSSRWSR